MDDDAPSVPIQKGVRQKNGDKNMGGFFGGLFETGAVAVEQCDESHPVPGEVKPMHGPKGTMF